MQLVVAPLTASSHSQTSHKVLNIPDWCYLHTPHKTFTLSRYDRRHFEITLPNVWYFKKETWGALSRLSVCHLFPLKTIIIVKTIPEASDTETCPAGVTYIQRCEDQSRHSCNLIRRAVSIPLFNRDTFIFRPGCRPTCKHKGCEHDIGHRANAGTGRDAHPWKRDRAPE